ncbi:hypothetical protein Nmel_001755, partial [Mimus melanotis]
MDRKGLPPLLCTGAMTSFLFLPEDFLCITYVVNFPYCPGVPNQDTYKKNQKKKNQTEVRFMLTQMFL